MNITITDQEKCKKELRLEIPAEIVRAETDRVAQEFARQVNVPGFRRGHVPKSVVKTRFRKELRDEVLSHLIPHSLGDAIREKELKVMGEPSISDLKFGDDESIDVTFTVEVAPEFELSNYKELPVTKRVYKVRDEDVERVINQFRENHAELVPVEDRAAQTGDIVTINVTGHTLPAEGEQTVSAEAGETAGQEGAETSAENPVEKAEGAEAKVAEPEDEINQRDVEIQLGAEGVMKEFNEALTGTRPADVRTFVVEYPATEGSEQTDPHRVQYTAEITAVRAKELPEADDEFVQSISEELKTIDELRADIRSKLEHQARHKSEDELRAAIMDRLVDQNSFDVPEFIVEKQVDSRLNSSLRQLVAQGVDLRHLNLDFRGLRESIRERAEREVRGSFILDRIAEAENIEVGDDELNQELEQMAARMGQTPDALKARLTKEDAMDSIRGQVRDRKALDLVIASANIQTEEIEGLDKEDRAGDEGQRAEA